MKGELNLRRREPTAGCLEQCNEVAGSVKDEEFTDHMSDYQLSA
jgi:hypothetical protein